MNIRLKYKAKEKSMRSVCKGEWWKFNKKGVIANYTEKKFNNLINFCILIIVGIFVLIVGVYINIFNGALNDYMEGTLHELARKNAAVVERQIMMDMETLEVASKIMELNENQSQDRFLASVSGSKKMGIFKEVGLSDLEGNAVTTLVDHVNIGDREHFKEALQGKSNVSDIIVDRTDFKEIIIYSTPVYKEGEIVAVIFATNNIEDYSRILDLNVFEKSGYTHVIKSNGDYIIKSTYKDDKGYKNLFSEMRARTIGRYDKESMHGMENHVRMQKSGVLEVEVEKGKRYVSYAPIDINDWYVIFIVRKNLVMENLMSTFNLAFWSFILILVGYIGVLIYLMRSNGKNKLNLKRLAYVDEITMHANYRKMTIEVKKILDNAKDKRYAYLVFDIDKFKDINDLYGYEQGSIVLKQIVDRVGRALFYDERITRIYNDKFAVLIRYFDKVSLAKRIKEVYEGAILQGDIIVSTFVMSTGVYVIEDNSESIDDIRDKANLARKTVKNSHKSSMAFYDENLINKMLYEQEVTNEMQDALKNGEFKIYMQPKYDLKTKKLCSSEALIRWEHPHKGIIPASRFIPIFEDNGFIKEIDLYVFEEVCRKLNEWIGCGLTPPIVSVNLSRVHMFDRYIPEKLEFIAKKYLVNPEMLELEITESVVLDKSKDLIYIIEKMKMIGFRIAMDDFGKGYSSLNLLKDLPIDVLKLDKEFLESGGTSSNGMVVIKDIIVMAKHLDLEVVAEGIETEEQYELLKSMDCDVGQGFLFSKAVTMKEYEKVLRDSLTWKREDKN